MARHFNIKSFLRHCEEDSLKDFFAFIKINKEYPAKEKDEKHEVYFFRYIYNSLSYEEQLKAERYFRDINELSEDESVNIFLDLRLFLSKEIQDIENPYNKSLYIFIHHNKTFKLANISHEVINLKTRKEVLGLEKMSKEDVLSQIEPLQEALKEFFVDNEGRGRNCNIESCIDEDRVSLIAYPEDYLKSDERYNKQGEFEKGLRMSVTKIVYIYYPKIGKLELGAKGKDKRKINLVNAFIKSVLESENIIHGFKDLYDLDTFLDETKELGKMPEDEIEYIKVREIALQNINYSGEQIILIT